MMRFLGKAVLITGAGSGLGKAVAERFGAEGARVACLDVVAHSAEATATEVRSKGGEAFAVCVDVSNEASVSAGVRAVLEWSGGVLDVLVNVAGIGLPASTLTVTLKEWNRIIAINLTGTFLMSRNCLPALVERKGSIVNVASVAGLRGNAYQAAYSASKAGVVMLTKSLALEFAASGVRINCVCPGGIATPFVDAYRERLAGGSIDVDVFTKRTWSPLGKPLADASEIGAVIAFVASSEASFMTGSAVVVDGGNTA